LRNLNRRSKSLTQKRIGCLRAHRCKAGIDSKLAG
jgi:hypothetical protein